MRPEETAECFGKAVFSIDKNLYDKAKSFARKNNINVCSFIEEAIKNSLNDIMITYIMGDDTGCVKIGKTKDLDRRYRQLSSGNPTLKLLFEHEGDIESRLHQQYKDFNVNADGSGTEWFKLSLKQLEDIIFTEHFHLIDEYDWEMFITKLQCD